MLTHWRLVTAAGAFLTCLLALSSYAAAQDIRALTLFRGSCTYQIGTEIAPCKDAVAWTEYRNGRASLGFFSDKFGFGLYGGGDRQPNPENYYQKIDTIRIFRDEKNQQSDGGMEGECHFHLNSDATKFYSINCTTYNRRKGTLYKFILEGIHTFDRKSF